MASVFLRIIINYKSINFKSKVRGFYNLKKSRTEQIKILWFSCLAEVKTKTPGKFHFCRRSFSYRYPCSDVILNVSDLNSLKLHHVVSHCNDRSSWLLFVFCYIVKCGGNSSSRGFCNSHCSGLIRTLVMFMYSFSLSLPYITEEGPSDYLLVGWKRRLWRPVTRSPCG